MLRRIVPDAACCHSILEMKLARFSVGFALLATVVAADVARVAILKDDLPASPAAASPEYLGRILQSAGFATKFLNCSQLGDSNGFNRQQFDVVVLPYGPAFPVKAADNFRVFLRAGGKFFSTGGYAFDDLLERTTNGWQRPKSPPLPPVSHVLWRYRIPADELRDSGGLKFSGCLKTQNIRGSGMAYFAVYQYSENGSIVEWEDLCKVRGSQDWKGFQYGFRAHPKAKTVELQAGLYECGGVAWFDDLQLADERGNKLLTAGFEEPFDPDTQSDKQWLRSDQQLCAVQNEIRHSGHRALKATLHYFLPPEEALNTRHGRPEDGLEVGPDQLGVFQPDYTLERVHSARAAFEQAVVRSDLRIEHPLQGYAACGVAGFDRARWLALINADDRYGRLRGAAGAMLRHYTGDYAGSSWAFFGVTNRNLFADTEPGMDRAFVDIVRSLARDTYIALLTPDRGCYRQGESVKLLANLFNGGRSERKLRLNLRIYDREALELDGRPADRLVATLETNLVVSPRQVQPVALEWKPEILARDFYYVTARLYEGEEEIDRLASGFVIWNDRTIAAGPLLNFRDNYLRLGKRPMFLFGTDDWAYTFNTTRETPLQWLRDMRQRRDLGVQIYENLQFGALPPFTTEDGGERRENLLRKVDGIVQLAQKYQQVYFAGLLIGDNTAASDAKLTIQIETCREFAKRYAKVPGLIHYLNGDLRCQLNDGVTPQWNEFLRERYGTTEKLRAAWGLRAPAEELGTIPAEDFNDWNYTWDDMKLYDLNRFRAWLIRRWHSNLVANIREFDQTHPTTSEFYQLPHSGVDVPAGIDGLDLCNFGYFDKPGADLARFPAICKYNDQRARGKSVGPGEYGVKTHPAWGDGKDYGYHITRTREQAVELFLGIAHYSLALGASRIHNWCWKDCAHRVFPWGMIYPCDGVPKDTAYVHRNQSLLFRHFAPVYREPEVYVLTPDGHRFGGGKWQVIEGVLKSYELALATHVENLGTLNEDYLDLPRSAKAIFYPLPFCPPDDAYNKLLNWVEQGGVLYLSGDISYDEFRKRTRTKRLEELCGVRFVAENYPNISLNATNAADQPCIKVEPAAPDVRKGKTQEATSRESASSRRRLRNQVTVLKRAADGSPMLIENKVGRGKVLFTTDPIELHSVPARRENDLSLYRSVLAATKVKPIGLQPDDPLLHVFRVPLQGGGKVYILFNTDERQPARTITLTDCKPAVTLTLASKRPALLWFDGRRALRGVEVQGDCVIDGKPVVSDSTQGIIMTLDGKDVRETHAVLLMPLRAGVARLARSQPWHSGSVSIGEVHDGKWVNGETMALDPIATETVVRVSPDQVFSLVLLSDRNSTGRWSAAIERAFCKPAALP